MSGLVRHPAPYGGESLFGYVLRLSELNGYDSPRYIRQLANIDTSVSLGTRESLLALAGIANQNFGSELQDQNDSAARSILVGPRDAEFHRASEWTLTARICPDCIEDKGYIEAHWAIPHVFACPVHRWLATSICPGCRKPLRWYRRGLLECSCGAILTSDHSRQATDRELALLDLIRRKALGEPMPENNPYGFPSSHLVAIPLRQLIEMVDALARAQEATIGRDKRQAVFLAARILSGWPQRFLEYLDPPGGPDGPLQLRKNLLRLHDGLCGPENASRSHMDFLGAVMVEYAFRRWGYRHSQLQRYGSLLQTGLLDHMFDHRHGAPATAMDVSSLSTRTKCAAEAAQYLGCSPTAVQGLVRSGKLSGTVNAARWRVENESLERFRREYVFLREIAKSERRSIRTLRTVCCKDHIQVFVPRAEKASGIQLYIRATVIKRLKSGLNRRQASRGRE
jgi:TniQ/Helix-turn-helix domain